MRNTGSSPVSKKMKTDEDGANASDRQIPITATGMLHEILGNMTSIWQAIFMCTTFARIITFNESSWTNDDKTAIFTKRKSGSSRDTASINGHGIKLILDKILNALDEGTPSWKKTWATYYVTRINADNELVGEKCRIGHFQYTEWEPMDTNDIGRYKSFKSDIGIPNTVRAGTLCYIPINSWAKKELNKNKRNRTMIEYLRRSANLYLNKVNLSGGAFYFNGQRQQMVRLCNDNAIEIKLKYYWDTDNNTVIRTTNAYFEIQNYEDEIDESGQIIKGVSTYFPLVKKRFRAKSTQAQCENSWKKKDLTIEYTPVSQNPMYKEDVILRFSIISKEESINQARAISPAGETELEGVMLYYNNRCLTETAFKKGMGGKTADGGGALGLRYDGKMRHEIIILQKRSMWCYLPADKNNVKLTGDGNKLMKIFRFFSELHDHQVKNKDQYLPLVVDTPPIPIPIPIPTPPSPPPRPTISQEQKDRLWRQQYTTIDGHILYEVKCMCTCTMTPCWGGNPKSHLCHIKAHSNGGSIDDTNLYWACHRCNGNSTKDFLSEIAERCGKNSPTYNSFKNDLIRLNKTFVEPEN